MICKTRYKYFISVEDIKKILQKLKFIVLHIHQIIEEKMTLKNLSRRHCGRCQSEVSRFKKQKFTIKRYYLKLTTILDIHSSLRKYCDYVKFAEMAGNKDLKWPYAAPGQRHTHCCLKVVFKLS